MNYKLLHQYLEEAKKALNELVPTVRSLKKAEVKIREAKGILQCHDPVKHTDKGQRIMTLDKKLDALLYCFEHQAFEDAAAHVIDLLFHAAERVVDGADVLQYVREMLRRGPVLVEPDSND